MQYTTKLAISHVADHGELRCTDCGWRGNVRLESVLYGVLPSTLNIFYSHRCEPKTRFQKMRSSYFRLALSRE